MGQIAAALLFAVAAGLGVTVILAMLKTNGHAILSALAGEGAFPVTTKPQAGPTPQVMPMHRSALRREASRPVRGAATPPQFSCAA